MRVLKLFLVKKGIIPGGGGHRPYASIIPCSKSPLRPTVCGYDQSIGNYLADGLQEGELS